MTLYISVKLRAGEYESVSIPDNHGISHHTHVTVSREYAWFLVKQIIKIFIIDRWEKLLKWRRKRI